MSFTIPLFVPLTSGLDLSKEATLGERPLTRAHNVDFTVDGQVRGRPSRAAPAQFAVRDASDSDPTYVADADFDDTGFTPLGLVPLRDGGSERPGLACAGRLFAKDTARWVDRGPFACTRVDRHANFRTGLTSTAVRYIGAPDFGFVRSVTVGTEVFMEFHLLAEDGSYQRTVRVTTGGSIATAPYGSAARSGATTAMLMVSANNKLHMFYRTAGGDTVTRVELATDARVPSDEGDSPVICPRAGGGGFYVAYRTTTTDELCVIGIGLTGTIGDGPWTNSSLTNLHGIWVDHSVSGGPVLIAATDEDGLHVFQRDADLANSAGSTMTYATTDCLDVVVGQSSQTGLWWACRLADSSGDGDILVGSGVTSSSSLSLLRRYYGGGAFTEAAIKWAICHQPITIAGRTYLTLAASTNRATTATWITLDLTNCSKPNDVHPFANPMLVARGPASSTVPHLQPSTAMALADGTGWLFNTLDWSALELTDSQDLAGITASSGLARVTLSKPRVAVAGASTVFSGSVPYHLAGGQCHELGFPFLAGTPGLSVTATGGGAVGIGNYTLVAVWRWTDERGQIHRSAPSAARVCTVPGSGTNTITAVVTNPWLSGHPYADLSIELYCTDIDPTDDAPRFLQATAGITTSAAYTTFTINTQPVTDSDVLYTDGGVLGNYHVRGDGGVAALGRRLWVADANTVYASKYLQPGVGPEFNDEGTHQVDLPANAGRIVALEALDDKLVIFCERGVYLIQDGGPDRTGVGPDFGSPLRVSDLSVAGPRSTCWTDAGVVFCTAYNTTDQSRGGPWLIDRQFTFTERQYLGRPALDYFGSSEYPSFVPEVAYAPERQQLFITAPEIEEDCPGLVVFDARTGKWATWSHQSVLQGGSDPGALRSIATVGGVVWALGDQPAPYSGAPGSDAVGGSYPMIITTGHYASNGQDGLGWGRTRAVSVLVGSGPAASHSLTISALMDGMGDSSLGRSYSSGTYNFSSVTPGSTWPTDYRAPEWRLPSQKCSTIQVTLLAQPATARWAAIRLDVQPLPRRAPAFNRK